MWTGEGPGTTERAGPDGRRPEAAGRTDGTAGGTGRAGGREPEPGDEKKGAERFGASVFEERDQLRG